MYACIDLGSNSFHLLIGEWVDGRVEIVERYSEKVQLGESAYATGVISTAAFERGILCLKQFKTLMDKYPLERYWALGTNTFRITANSEDFIQSAKRIGIHVSTISGVQEAVLIYAGVISELPTTDNHRLVVDIGGGSTEIIVGKQHTRLLTESMAIGSVAWRDKFFSNKTPNLIELEQSLDEAVDAARQVFAQVAPGISKAAWSEAYASSGTVKMLALICNAHGHSQGQIKLQTLQQLKPLMLDNILNDTDLPGLKERRRDVLLSGWSVLVGLMQAYSIETINFSATALREGMLDFMVKNTKTLPILMHSDLPKVSYAKTSVT
ncbi:MAG: hypothetical protein COA96_14030 [SAR86 cluster bacterium]|uniref:Ppx/GppA phosphatase N-terminal domain-containing protein n=1 Tax=SAR86 cluster bacterium TaxID=2030880 RepID=A0A2A5ATJ2_9GAMM|nr:MAG: hypothetical protein COA96_14030 [SAR86 cluster bacterium]